MLHNRNSLGRSAHLFCKPGLQSIITIEKVGKNMKCSECGCENSSENKFCKKCGSMLQIYMGKTCVSCGKELKENAKFCTYCGQRQDVMRQKNQKVILILLLVLVLLAVLAVGGVGAYWYLNNSDNSDSEVIERYEEEKPTEVKREEESSVEETQEAVEQVEEVKEEKAEETNVVKGLPIPLTASVNVSSCILDENFSATGIMDGDADTAWAENGAGIGRGEYIEFHFPEKTDIYGVAILVGNLKSESNYVKYACPSKVKVVAGDKTEIVDIDIKTPDFDYLSDSYQYIDFEEPFYTDTIQVEIMNARKGTEFDISCISELHLYTYPEKGKEDKYDAKAWNVAHEEEDYLLPDSDTKYLTTADLAGFTQEECRLARNELYARHGRIFNDEGLQKYFESKDWYRGMIDGDDFKESMLNDYEIANRDLIVSYEEEQGYR